MPDGNILQQMLNCRRKSKYLFLSQVAKVNESISMPNKVYYQIYGKI